MRSRSADSPQPEPLALFPDEGSTPSAPQQADLRPAFSGRGARQNLRSEDCHIWNYTRVIHRLSLSLCLVSSTCSRGLAACPSG